MVQRLCLDQLIFQDPPPLRLLFELFNRKLIKLIANLYNFINFINSASSRFRIHSVTFSFFLIGNFLEIYCILTYSFFIRTWMVDPMNDTMTYVFNMSTQSKQMAQHLNATLRRVAM